MIQRNIKNKKASSWFRGSARKRSTDLDSVERKKSIEEDKQKRI